MDTISKAAISAFYQPIKRLEVTITPWAYAAVRKGASRYSDLVEYDKFNFNGRALPAIHLQTEDNVDTLESHIIKSLNFLNSKEELGLVSKVIVYKNTGPEFAYVEMMDFAPNTSYAEAYDFQMTWGVNMIRTGNSFHSYGEFLMKDENAFRRGLEEHLIRKSPIDTAWAGFTLAQNFAILRVSGLHKTLPTAM